MAQKWWWIITNLPLPSNPNGRWLSWERLEKLVCAKEFLKNNPALMAEIRAKVLTKHGITKADTSNVDMVTGEIKEDKAAGKSKAKVQ